MTGSTRAAPSRLQGDNGSVLMLMPAAVLVVLVLGAIAVDLSVVHLARRNLINVASSAANDAATAGLPPASLRGGGSFAIDRSLAIRAAERSVAAHGLPSDSLVDVVAAGDEVTVVLSVHVNYIFAKAIPGSNDGTTVRATASAVAAHR